jgi:cell division protein ZapA (FtsZ GTPase activity inhibitor)
MKNKVNICNQPYTIIGEESDEYIQKLANMVDKKMKEILNTNERISVTMAAVLTALDFCDENLKNQTTSDNLRGQLKKYYDDAIKARNESEDLKKEIASVKEKIQKQNS